MGDPISILASALTILDASKKVVDVCTDYVKHAKNAPKELQTIIEDIQDLNGTVKRIESVSRVQIGAIISRPDHYDQFRVPLLRLQGYAQDLVDTITGKI